jgi:hypothetical protein
MIMDIFQPFVSDEPEEAGSVAVLVHGRTVELLTPEEARTLAHALLSAAEEVQPTH